MTSEIKVDTISEQTSANGVTIDGLTIKDGNIIGDVALAGTTPTFTVGDGGAEDAALIFDGNALDYYIALDDSADNLIIGSGSTVGSNSLITIDSDGDFTLDSAGDIILDADGAQVIFKDAGTTIGGFNNSSSDLNIFSHVQDKDIVFTGDDGGATITALTLDMSNGGRANFGNDIGLNDDRGIRFGAGDDLTIFHDGSDSYIRDSGTGLLFIRGSSGVRIQGANGEAMVHAVENGAVELYNDNSKKLETTATGIDVTGTVTSDGASLDGAVVINEASADVDFRVESNNNEHKLFVDGGNNVLIISGGDGGSGTVPVPINTNGGTDPTFQLQGANNANSYTFHIMGGIDAQNNPPAIYFSKSRSNTLAQNTILQNGDRIGEIVFAPADGVDRNSVAAFICSDVDGTPGENDTPGRLEFHTTADGANTSTERVRITQSGDVLIGTVSTTINSSNAGIALRSYGEVKIARTDAGASSPVLDVYGQAGQFKIQGDGDAENTNNNYTGLSDERIKTNITDANSQWDDIKAIKVRNFERKDHVAKYGAGKKVQIGVIAQQVESVSPKLVKERDPTEVEINMSSEFGTLYTADDAETKDGNDIVLYVADDQEVISGEYSVGDIKMEATHSKKVGDIKETKDQVKSVSYSVLYMKAVKALQEAQTRIETLETKVAALEG